ncbi:hypothetical protein [Novosphingobium sp. PhB55]|uniref:hypothetical protein n=1 Tax=Novosphingobium sp. PhB55 TaxID=2485106 RepID=UPI001416F46D|nr:hypothetical protein [Novosphingobium sp. PhB55]
MKNSADPSDALLVLIAAPLSEMHGSLFDSTKLAQLTEKHFGWTISASTLDFFVPKMRQLGWLESRTKFPARGPFFVNLPTPDFTDESFDTEATLKDVGEGFLKYAREISPLSVLPPEPSEAGAILLRYAVDANVSASNKDNAGADETFLAARYIEHVNTNKLPQKEAISSLSAVGYLFRVAEELQNPTNSCRKFEVTIVVDGPILLDHLGCSGALRSGASKELFDRMRALGASVTTFHHCVDEARDVLASVLRAPAPERYGPTADALRKGLVHETALQNMLQAFDMAVRKAGVEILPDTLDFMPSSHRFFNDEKSKALESIVNWHDADNENARYADSDTAVFTIRRRAGAKSSDLFTSKFVCVTTNDTFAGAIRRHLCETYYYNKRHIPPIITMRELSAKLWLEVGNIDRSARLSLPNSQLLVTCEKALRYNRKVVDRARDLLREVKPEQLDQFEILLEVPRSARAVMDFALNNEGYVSGDNVEGLVEAAIQAAGKEVADKAKAQREKDLRKHQEQLALAEKATEDTRTLAEEQIAQERERAEAILEAEKRKSEEAARSLQAISAEHARVETRAREADNSITEAIGERATERFGFQKSFIRNVSVIVAIVPLAITCWSFLYRENSGLNWYGMFFAALVAILGAATAMDRPGAWLSKQLQQRIESWADRRVRELGRHDLACEMELHWHDGKATVTSHGE